MSLTKGISRFQSESGDGMFRPSILLQGGVSVSILSVAIRDTPRHHLCDACLEGCNVLENMWSRMHAVLPSQPTKKCVFVMVAILIRIHRISFMYICIYVCTYTQIFQFGRTFYVSQPFAYPSHQHFTRVGMSEVWSLPKKNQKLYIFLVGNNHLIFGSHFLRHTHGNIQSSVRTALPSFFLSPAELVQLDDTIFVQLVTTAP